MRHETPPDAGDPLEAAGLLTRDQAAELACCHPRTISRAVSRGALAVVRVGAAPSSPYLLKRSDVEAFAATRDERIRRGGRPRAGSRLTRAELDRLRKHAEELEQHAHALREIVAAAL